MQADVIQVMTTTGTKASAQQVAEALVGQRLAACVQVIGPITSTYWWEGAMETAEEWLCLAKSSRARYAALETAILEVHPYDTPEILAVPVVEGSAAYLRWLASEIRTAG